MQIDKQAQNKYFLLLGEIEYNNNTQREAGGGAGMKNIFSDAATSYL